jgi:hypothetical protein
MFDPVSKFFPDLNDPTALNSPPNSTLSPILAEPRNLAFSVP